MRKTFYIHLLLVILLSSSFLQTQEGYFTQNYPDATHFSSENPLVEGMEFKFNLYSKFIYNNGSENSLSFFPIGNLDYGISAVTAKIIKPLASSTRLDVILKHKEYFELIYTEYPTGNNLTYQLVPDSNALFYANSYYDNGIEMNYFENITHGINGKTISQEFQENYPDNTTANYSENRTLYIQYDIFIEILDFSLSSENYTHYGSMTIHIDKYSGLVKYQENTLYQANSTFRVVTYTHLEGYEPVVINDDDPNFSFLHFDLKLIIYWFLGMFVILPLLKKKRLF
jgi:hypothetical protein